MNADRQRSIKDFIADVQVKDEVRSVEDNEDEQCKF